MALSSYTLTEAEHAASACSEIFAALEARGHIKKKDPCGSFFILRFAGGLLLLVAAFASRVARHAAQLIIRAERVALVRVAGIAALRSVADALIALQLC